MLIASRDSMTVDGCMPTAKDYVQDGLVAMWDGIENAGWGVHDSTANHWKELVSDTNSQVLDSAFTWGDNFLSTQGGTRASTGLYPSNLLSDRTPGTAYSIEIVYRDYVSGGAQRQLLSASNNTTIRISTYVRTGFEQFDIRFNGKSYYIYKENSSAVAGSHAVTMTCDGVDTKVYIDGKYVAPVIGGGIGTGTPATGIAYFAWNAPSVHSEKYCRMALHKRALTASEIAANYAIDKARFNLPDAL